jgi:hypothetical protein
MLLLLISALTFLIKVHKNSGLSFIAILLLVSMLQISPEFFFGVKTTGFEFFYIEDSYNLVILILMTFISTIAIFTDSNDKQIKINSSSNPIVFLILFFVSLYILVFGINRGSLIGYTVRINTLYEYFIITYVLLFYYAKKTPLNNIFMIVYGFIYILQDFYYGGRISSLQLFIVILILFLPKKISIFNMVLIIIPGYIFLKVIELYRTGEIQNLSNILGYINNPITNYQINTFSEVLYSSSGLVFSSQFLFTIFERLNFFMNFLKSIFIGAYNEESNIVSYISNNVSSVGGGGFFPVYLYFWIGWIGVFVSGIAFSVILNLKIDKTNDYLKILYIIVLSTFPRWFYYSPLVLFRLAFLNFTIVYIFTKVLDNLLKNQNKYFKNFKT